MRTNQASGSSLVIERSITVERSPAEAMAPILSPRTWPSWQAEIKSAQGPERLQPGDVVRGRAVMMGFDVDGQSVTTEVAERAYQQDVVVGVGMQIRYEVGPSPDGGTVIRHRLTSQLPEGALGRMLSFFLTRRLKKMQRDLLERLAAQLEAPSA